jgi:hypothetical protein
MTRLSPTLIAPLLLGALAYAGAVGVAMGSGSVRHLH